ncbi:hypothetical protein CPB84DRAFT_379290 [Gymnopilus junonius]|uniref:Uncharacterized protein n=1 Tax=Gymnopilus junonius TaxID=109634 RepID=A0A9P5TG72_GYMJU|nr:hypothetical protein CPB84DRAFT_379290 [Gymnopilus junonius]
MTSALMNALREPGILVTIFLIVCWDPITIPILPINPHIRLLHVCNTWRTVMLSLPGLWDTYIFSVGFFRRPRLQIDIFNYFVTWSGFNALTLIFLDKVDVRDHGSLEDNLFGGGRISIVDDIISPYANRIKFIRCLLNGNENRKFLLGIQQGAFSSLEGIDITFINIITRPYSAFTSQDISHFRTFASLPRLRNATCRIFSGINPIELNLPYSTLTALDLDASPISPKVFNRIMYLTRDSLIDGHFYLDFRTDLIDSLSIRAHNLYTSPIVMSSLSTFNIFLINSSVDPDFILNFRFPLIQDLCVERAEKVLPFKWDLRQYSALLSSSAGLLKKLRLASFALKHSPSLHGHGLFCLSTPSDDVEALFRIIPRLTNLQLSTGSGIHAVTFGKIGRGEMLPQLTTIDLTADIDPIPFFKMIKTRNAPTHSPATSLIKSFSLTLPSTTSYSTKVFEKEIESLVSVEERDLLYLPSCDICDRI